MVQERMESSFRNYIQTVLDLVEQSIEANQLNVEGDICSLGTALTQDIFSMCARISEHLAIVRQDVSGSDEGPRLQ